MTEQPKAEHTPEPWHIENEPYNIWSERGGLIARLTCPMDPTKDGTEPDGPWDMGCANGRRIVACVNALAGHDPESVKRLITIVTKGRQLGHTQSQLDFARMWTTYGKLLEGCKHFVKWAERLRDDGVCPVPIGLSLVKDVIAEIDAPEDTPQ